MTILWNLAAFVVVPALVGIASIPFSIRRSVRQLRDERLIPLAPNHADYPLLHHQCSPFISWLNDRGFRWIGFFRTPMGVLMGTWREPETNRFFSVYMVAGNRYYEFVTNYDKGLGLVTGIAASMHLFPKWPGSYVQSFSKLDVEQLWQRHDDAEKLLTGDGGARHSSDLVVFELNFSQSMKLLVEWVQNLRGWPIRSIYWYFVRRHLLHNKSIAEQLRRGWIQRPRDLPEASLQRVQAMSERIGQSPPVAAPATQSETRDAH